MMSHPDVAPEKRKHAHYFKDVEHLDEVDVYRVCDIFSVDDCSGATQHAIKKLLLPGQRGGGKDRRKDLQEAVDTLKRRIEMMNEDDAIAALKIGQKSDGADTTYGGVWMTWDGRHDRPYMYGFQPETVIEVKFRDGLTATGRAGDFRWSHAKEGDQMLNRDRDVVMFRKV